MDEFACIAEIRRRLEAGWPVKPADVTLGIGDDAALLAPSMGQQVLSVDTMVENVHFRRGWLSDEDLGFRAISAAISDLAAMGSRPRAALLSLIVPKTRSVDSLLAIVDGVAEAARTYRMPVLGGNLATGGELSITTTVIGEISDRVLLRRGAHPGDRVFITGSPGRAALGLAMLYQGRTDEPDGAACLARWRRPLARIDEGFALASVATSAIDVSDGLLQDLRHLCDASAVGARVTSHTLPIEAAHAALASRLGLDAIELALAGGEDYELLFTLPAHQSPPIAATAIGTIEKALGLRVEDRAGRCTPAEVRGFRHPIGADS